MHRPESIISLASFTASYITCSALYLQANYCPTYGCYSQPVLLRLLLLQLTGVPVHDESLLRGLPLAGSGSFIELARRRGEELLLLPDRPPAVPPMLALDKELLPTLLLYVAAGLLAAHGGASISGRTDSLSELVLIMIFLLPCDRIGPAAAVQTTLLIS